MNPWLCCGHVLDYLRVPSRGLHQGNLGMDLALKQICLIVSS